MKIFIKILLLSAMIFAVCDAKDKMGETLEFFHKDWFVICDNTATCRIFGEQVTNWGYTLSVLFTRPAGADSKITGEVKYSYNERDDFDVELFISGKSYGEVKAKEIKYQFGSYWIDTLDDTQVRTLFAALKGSPKIQFKNLDQDISMQLSAEGFNAVWLKMREWQGLLKG